ncbi:MFS transporter [Nocardia cyriacigeorgica]|uniref:MFS transporter n=1 Tax=Nocardia cyriacigeorgica TaxID=135487 RepID=UPI00030E37D3|nr:MFS transporter [Nocardia cyriacigeorgica]
MTSTSLDEHEKPSDDPPTLPPVTGGWGELLSRRHIASVAVLAGGVALYAMNLYFTAALMPSIVDDIGGADYYAWVATGFLMAAVIASMLVSRILGNRGVRGAYLVGFLTFAIGAAANALSPTMELLLAGRVIQGFGGGLLAGLGYAVIRAALPSHLWARAAGLVSAMWGVGTLVGPTLGGAFAQVGGWRWAYALLLLAAVALAVLGYRALPPRTAAAAEHSAVPMLSLSLLTAAAAVFSISSTVASGWPTAGCMAAGAVLLALFLVAEKRGSSSVLPRSTYQRDNPLKWVYLTVAALCAGVMTENFIPLFGQELGNLAPFAAGLLGAALSIGWVVSQLFSVNLGPAAARRAVRIAPVLLTGGLLAYGFAQSADAAVVLVLLWAAALFLAGTGIGLAFPHLSVAAMSSTTDENEGAKAAAALSTTQLIAYTVTSAVAGTLVNLGGDSVLHSSRLMTFGIAAITVAGTVTALRATPRSRPAAGR